VIRPLRQRHRVMLLTLAAGLPLAFAGGIAGRKAVPVMNALPAALTGEHTRPSQVLWERDEFLGKHPIAVRMYRDERSGSGFAMELVSRVPLVGPDLLVYWIPGAHATTRDMPNDARLLGTFTPNSVLMAPKASITQPGMLVLYSLANQEVLATSREFLAAATGAQTHSAGRPPEQLLAFNTLPNSIPPARSRFPGCLVEHDRDHRPIQRASALRGARDSICGPSSSSSQGD
jgi:hypothetical protein